MFYGNHIWLEEQLMQVKDDDDLHRGQRLTEINVVTVFY